MAEYAIYPMRVIRFSSLYNSRGHIPCSKGKPNDYPTDLTGASPTDRMWMVNTLGSDLKVLRRYNKASHAMWLRTVDRVYIPCQKNPVYLYMMIEHQDLSEMKAVNAVYKQGDKIVREGSNGRATGPHLHVSFGYSTKPIDHIGTGWRCNSRGAYVLYIPGVKNVKINDALYINDTISIKDNRVKFKTAPKQRKLPIYKVGQSYVLQANMNIRTKPSSTSAKVPVREWTPNAQKHANKAGLLKKGTVITIKKIYKKGNVCWLKTPTGWVCGYNSNRVYVSD